MANSLGKLIILGAFIGLAACAKPFATDSSDVNDSSSQGVPGGTSPVDSGNAGPLQICSKLSFNNVAWDQSLTSMDRAAFQLALNISGSFEGNTGWANLTNNFDGQGLSMGLLNQTLGTGSLQPLMTKMRALYFSQMQSLFSASHFQSLSDMLTAYGASVQLSGTSNRFLLDSSPLDQDWSPTVQLFAATRESNSVSWAVQNLYNGTAFKPDWSKELTALATHPLYVSLQIEAAEVIHAKARSLQNTLGLYDLRSYLVMFDFVVQNGGLGSQEIPEYQAAVAANPSMTVTQKLNKILELRLRRVIPQYVEDVRSRKTALINGAGTVHGANRQLEKEYCYQGTLSYQP